jgi:hypothetical protein
MGLRFSAALGNAGAPRLDYKGWLWRILYILYSLEVGIILLVLPWLGLWENNYLLYLHPRLLPVVSNPYLKGAVLGLGIVNIMIGVQDIVQFRNKSKGDPG